MKGIIACGHPLTAKAAAEMFELNGNAFDAAVAAVFAACVTEPMLTGLAGGGLALVKVPKKETVCVDFLPTFPRNALGRSCKKQVDTHAGTFSIGYDTIAVPGTMKGLLYIHKKYGKLVLLDILRPAINYASEGIALASVQAYICSVCREFCTFTSEGREIFAPKGRMLTAGEIIHNRKCGSFLEKLGQNLEEGISFYYDAMEKTIKNKDCSISMEEVRSYKVEETEPISVDYHGRNILLCPPPSAGGLLIAHALNIMKDKNIRSMKHNSLEHIELLIQTLRNCSSVRTKSFYSNLKKPGFWETFLGKPNVFGNTTHVSVIDKEGNAASITSSNGTNSGIIIKDTGILMNNFVGEPDLIPYKNLYKPGERMASMMCPTMIFGSNGLETALGSGGSERIRSAIMQVVSNLIDFNMQPQQATDASRIHYDNLLRLEPGIEKKVLEVLAKKYEMKFYKQKEYYFGGVHIATPETGAGDHRRDGSVARV
jgi:gamma-glutamyltranspeptidase/glutathione hydrolase